MTRNLRKLTERQIQKALAEGKLSNLEGEGEPLPERPETAVSDPATLAGMKILAEAGVRPEEFDIKDQIRDVKHRLSEITDADQRKITMKELADLEMRLAIAQEARRKFLR